MDVIAGLRAICTTGKGRCWYCDVKLPKAERAISDGWDVQRIEEQPVASIILVCPACLGKKNRVQVTGHRVQETGYRAPVPGEYEQAGPGSDKSEKTADLKICATH